VDALCCAQHNASSGLSALKNLMESAAIIRLPLLRQQFALWPWTA
jgi:hypothetical protein